MSDRRSFIKSAALSAITLPLISSSKAEARILPKANSFVPEFPAQDDPAFWRTVRNMFPMRKDETYFNNGTLGPMPIPVLETITDDMKSSMENIAQCNWQGGNPSQGPKLIAGYGSEGHIREKLAKLINADVTEVSLTQNDTMGENFIANGLELNQGDEVLMDSTGYGRKGWLLRQARYNDVVVKMVEFDETPNDPQFVVETFAKAVTPKTRVIAFCHISSGLGLKFPAKEICAMARKRGIFTVVDAAQTIGQIPVDVKEIDCDAYHGSPHKWLFAPAGTGYLYINNDVASNIWTTIAGDWRKDRCKDHGRRFTARGTQNPSMAKGLEAAIDFHNMLGPKRVTDRIKYLGDYFRAGLKKIDKVEFLSATHPDMCAGMTTYNIKGVKSETIRDELWKRKRLRQRGIRFCTNIYNSVEEIDAALEILDDLAKNA